MAGPQGLAEVARWLQDNVWKVQEDFQRKVSQLDDLTGEQREIFTKEHVLYAIGELTELIDQIHWKIHRRQEWRYPSRSNIAIDIVDCFKYLLNVCLVWDIQAEDFLQTYAEKSRVVEERWRQEFGRPYNRAQYRGVVMVDIDGVLADYAGGYLGWIAAREGISIPVPERWTDVYDLVVAAVGAERANLLKHTFREDGGKLGLPLLPGARDLMDYLRSQNLYVALVTSRPYRQYRRILSDTLGWLDRHGIPYDTLICESLKASHIEKQWPDLLCAFEDDPSNAASIAAKGFRVLMPNQPYNRPTDPNEPWWRYEAGSWRETVPLRVEQWIEKGPRA